MPQSSPVSVSSVQMSLAVMLSHPLHPPPHPSPLPLMLPGSALGISWRQLVG